MSKLLLTITGPSGSGKTSVIHMLEKKYGVGRIITCTTRPQRNREKDGADYHFVSVKDFFLDFNCGNMIAEVEFAGNYYGIRYDDIQRQFESSDVLAVIVEPSGARELKLIFQDKIDIRNVYIEIAPKEAMARMIRRDGKAKARERQKADMEYGVYCDKPFELAEQYDCIIKNDKSNTVKSMAYDIMNYVEAQKMAQ